MLKKVDPGSGPGLKDHGYFHEWPVPFPMSRFASGKYPLSKRLDPLPGSTFLAIAHTSLS